MNYAGSALPQQAVRMATPAVAVSVGGTAGRQTASTEHRRLARSTGTGATGRASASSGLVVHTLQVAGRDMRLHTLAGVALSVLAVLVTATVSGYGELSRAAQVKRRMWTLSTGRWRRSRRGWTSRRRTGRAGGCR